ncbi:hypothetical protein UlMin_025395 [Ulmus minor]
MGSSERIKEAVVITPSDPTPFRNLPLSAIDSQLFLRFTIEYLLIYKPRSADGGVAAVARVKAALAKALVPYYPLAGRVRAKPDGSGLEVVCRAQGAVFIEAFSDRTVGEFDRAPKFVTQWRKLLSVHLTLLKDGGVALGVGFNHCICDGIGSAEFLNLFAELASAGGRRVAAEFKPKPVWDRHLLTRQKLVKPPLSLPVFNSVPDVSGFVTRFSAERLAPTSISFDRSALSELKNLASSRLSQSSSFTSFEVLSAHIWRSWARALNLPSNQVLKLLFSVNFRNRVKQSLPAGYYGNAFVLGCAQSSAKDLAEKGLWHAAALVKAAKERVGEEYVRAVVESVSESRACPDSVGVLILSQWSRLGLERVDFGLGRPVHVGPICSDRYCLFLPVFDQREAVKVMVAVPASAVDKYEYLVRTPYS